MKLPPTFLYQLFKENTFFLVDNTIYNPKTSGENGTFLKFRIDKGLKLSQLEELYFSNNENEIKEYRNILLQKILKDEKTIDKDYHRLGNEIGFLEIILDDLIKKRKNKIQIIKNEKSIINNLFKKDCFVLEGKIYGLSKKKNDLSARINNKEYNIGKRLELNLSELEKKYNKGIKEKIQKELTQGNDSLLSNIKKLKEKKNLIGILNKGEFFDKKENIGFKKDNKGFFATTRTGKYVLYEPANKKYYRFQDALIGVKLEKKNKRIIWNDPVVLNKYIHPALPSSRLKTHQKICKGDFDYKKDVQRKSIEEALRILLARGRFMILRGYFGEKGAWHSLKDEQFKKLETKSFHPKEVSNR